MPHSCRPVFLTLLLALIPLPTFAVNLEEPESPEAMVLEADFIALGELVPQEQTGTVIFKLQEILKSTPARMKVGGTYRVQAQTDELPYDVLPLATEHAGKPVIFLGRISAQERLLLPVYGNTGFWPYGITEDNPDFAFVRKRTPKALAPWIKQIIQHAPTADKVLSESPGDLPE